MVIDLSSVNPRILPGEATALVSIYFRSEINLIYVRDKYGRTQYLFREEWGHERISLSKPSGVLPNVCELCAKGPRTKELVWPARFLDGILLMRINSTVYTQHEHYTSAWVSLFEGLREDESQLKLNFGPPARYDFVG